MITTITNHVTTQGFGDTIDITPQVNAALEATGITAGLITVCINGSTAALTTIEYESGVVNDLKKALERLIPQKESYQHDARWGDGNGFSHVRASLIGPSISIPVTDGRMTLGTWQQIIVIDCDNTARERSFIIQVMGE